MCFFHARLQGFVAMFSDLTSFCFVSMQNKATNISDTNGTEIYNLAVTQRMFIFRPILLCLFALWPVMS